MNSSRKLSLVRDQHESPSSDVGVDEDEVIEAVAEAVRNAGDH